MKTSFLTRCLAMALALVMVISGANLGAILQVRAADPTINVGELIADNYTLSDAEENLLRSGLLTNAEVSYKVLPGALVNVDTDNHKITAASADGWVPTEALITYGSNTKTVDISSGEYNYNAKELGKAFSVEVTYVFNTYEVEVSTQSDILAAGAILKQGVANTEAVKNQSGNIYILEQAMPELVSLANGGISVNINGSTSTVGFSETVKAAISALNGQMTANGGVVNLSKMITEYEASTKTGYLLNNGAAMKAEVSSFYAYVAEIQLAMNTMVENLALFIQNGWVTEKQVNQLKNLANVCKNLKEGLAVVEADPWTALSTPNLVVEGVDYVALDAKVAALGATTDVALKSALKVAEATTVFNMSMFNVDIRIVLNAVNAENEVALYEEKVATFTLADGATKAEIEAAIAEKGTKAEALEAWAGIYVEEHFEETANAIPETLVTDFEYVVTFNPKNYTVTIDGEATKYPYGTKVTLPEHEDASQAYDYKDENGTYFAQGAEFVVEGDKTFTREEGKAYTAGSLMQIIADNYGNAEMDAILTSGALTVDQPVIYREPTLGELETLVVLEGSTLTVSAYDSSYKGLQWVPYSYVVDGAEYLFGSSNEVTISGDFTTVQVNYRLTLSNFSDADVKAILDLAKNLVEEAEGQKSVMDRLASYQGQMSQLNKNMLNGLNGMIGGYAVSEGGSFSDELVAQMKQIIGDIIANACAADGSLKLNGTIAGYTDANNGGLIYYYQNADEIIAQISYLSEKLEALLGDPQGLELISALLTDMNYGDYVEKLTDLNTKIAEIKNALQPVDEHIITTDAAKLSVLAKALENGAAADYSDYGSPYLSMGPITRTADKYVTVEVVANVDGSKYTTSETVLKNTALSADAVARMKAEIASFVAGKIDAELWNNDYANGSALDALVGAPLEAGATYTYTWTPKSYTVKIAGEADQTVSVKNLIINLPAHPQASAGMSYEYTVAGATANAGIYTFTTEQLKTLFEGGVYTITRIEKNAATEKLVAMVNSINADLGKEALKLTKEGDVYTALTADLGVNDMMGFMMGLVMNSGYSYVGLGGEGLVYESNSELEISLQTLIDAILSDDEFNNNTLIALGEQGKGKLVGTTIELGNSAAEYQQLEFVINLAEAPAQLSSNVELLKQISAYIKFKGNDGKLAVTVNLPDQVYAAYAAMLVATGNVDKTDVNALSEAVAIQFLYDYVLAFTESDMDMVTYTNTLKMLGINKDLTGYNGAYKSVISAYNEYVDVQIAKARAAGEVGATVNVSLPGKTVIDKLIGFAGIDASSVSTFLPMIKEYKNGGKIALSATADLANADKTYYALIADVEAAGMTDKFVAPSSYGVLAQETSTLAGYSAMMLLADVPGDLTISGNTILDLNGKNVAGTIKATGKLFIIDSTMDTYGAGNVDGVSGNVTVLAGNYASDVSAYLKAGYYMDGTTVRNTMYYITDKDGTVTFILNADFVNDEQLPNAMAVAVDIATDLALNYALSASLSVEGYSLVDVKLNDLVGLYASDSKAQDLLKQITSWFTIGEAGYDNNAGFEGVVNVILADILDFSAITTALENDSALATYAIELKPWTVSLEHIPDGNYLTVNFGSNDELPKNFNVALAVESKYNDKVAELTGELANIVVAGETLAMVDIPTPSFSNKELSVSAAGKAVAVVDLSADNDYARMIGVLLAYGNPAKKAAVANAINNNDMDALKTVVDNTSVQELFTALKKMSRTVDFAAMAAEVGVTADIASAADLEAIWHLYLCAAGKALEELDITGMSSKLGGLYNAETGCYELSKSKMFEKEISAKGYSALVNLEVTEVTLKVKLFGGECDLRDPNHDGVIDTRDVTYMRKILVGDREIICEKCADFNGDGTIDTRDLTALRNYLVNG